MDDFSADVSETSEGIEPSQQGPSKVTAPDYTSTKHKVKIDGQELDISYDELVKGYQLEKSSKTRFNEAARLQKQVESFVETLRSGDLSILRDIVPQDKLRDYSEKELLEYIQWENMSEHEKRAIVAERERDKYKSEDDKRKEQEQSWHMQQAEVKAAGEIDEQIHQAIEVLRKDVPYLKVDAELIQDIARHLEAQLLNGTDDRYDVNSATRNAWKGWTKKFGSYINALPPQELRKILGKDKLKALRSEDVEEAMSHIPNRIQKSTISSDDKPRKAASKIATDDYFSKLDKKFKTSW